MQNKPTIILSNWSVEFFSFIPFNILPIPKALQPKPKIKPIIIFINIINYVTENKYKLKNIIDLLVIKIRVRINLKKALLSTE